LAISHIKHETLMSRAIMIVGEQPSNDAGALNPGTGVPTFI
jgi:hypothetical protein